MALTFENICHFAIKCNRLEVTCIRTNYPKVSESKKVIILEYEIDPRKLNDGRNLGVMHACFLLFEPEDSGRLNVIYILDPL